MTNPTDNQVNALRIAIDALVRRFKITEAVDQGEPKLNAIDVEALFFVSSHPGCSASEVARHLSVVATTMSAVADRLVRKGLLTRARVSSNRRIVSLALTELGQQQVAETLGERNAHSRAMLKALTPEERTAFLRAVTKIAEAS